MTRIEITLSGEVDYDVRPGDGGLVVELAPLSAMGAVDGDDYGSETAPAEADPWAVVPDEESFDVVETDDTMADTVGSEIPASVRAKRLTKLDTSSFEEGAVIHLIGDGMFEEAEAFTLDNPARLVIDLPGVTSDVEQEKVTVASSRTKQVRVGAHSDKVRVVVDGANAEAFDGRRVLPVPTGLVVALGDGMEIDSAVETAMGSALDPSDHLAESSWAARSDEEPADAWGSEASDEMPTETALEDEPADDVWGSDEPMDDPMPVAEIAPEDEMEVASSEPASSLITVYGVEFDSQEGRDRVVVLSEEPVDYLVWEPDAETVVLTIEDAILDPDAAVRIAPEVGGPVSLVTAFEQPDVKRPEVRVVMKRASNLKPEVTRRGSLLMVDYPRTGAMAATPPVLRGDASVAQAQAPAAPQTTDDVLASREQVVQVAQPASVAPAAPGAIDPPAAIAILNEGGLMDGKEYVGRRISLDFKDVDVGDVLRLIAEVSDLNVIAGDEVKGKVTIRLVDVPWDQALDVILLTKGLGFIRIGNVLRIAAADVIAQEEELRLQERRAKEKLEDLVVKLQPVNYADVADVSRMVQQLLTPRGSVNTDTRTNTLIIKDIASVIDEATALVKAVDTMTPQVMIEAKIVEASLEFSREFGSIWSFGTNPLTQSTLGSEDLIFTQGSNNLGNNIAFGNSITAFPNSLASLAATVLDGKFNLEAQLQAAEVNGDGKVISSPRVITLDNSEAKIEQGISIPFQTFENGDAALEFVDAVLQLKTTPHITSDKSIIMEIEVSRNAPDDSVFTLTGSPAIAKNQVQTETLVKDGQTLVLGGIYVVDKSQRQSRVPYLHKIPFLGNAFKSDEFSDSRKELLIFVTPRIVQTPAAAS